jgi:alkylation response protein AidB-like acyl-CoA dehydrogenase
MLAKVYEARAVYLEATHVLLSLFVPGDIPMFMNTAVFARLYQSRPAERIRHSERFRRHMVGRMSARPRGEMERLQFYSSLAKVAGTDAGMENCHRALELMGQAGLRQDAGAEKLFRDAKLCQIFEGTNQLNRLNMFKHFIARGIPGLEIF